MAEEDSEHLGIMAYAAKFINMKPVSISAFSKYEQKQVIEKFMDKFLYMLYLLSHIRQFSKARLCLVS